jgi:hypothetical protein
VLCIEGLRDWRLCHALKVRGFREKVLTHMIAKNFWIMFQGLGKCNYRLQQSSAWMSESREF